MSSDPAYRAFGRLSLGDGLTLNVLFNSTASFSSFAVMSPTPAPAAENIAYNSTALLNVGIFTGAAFYDLTFDWIRDFQAAMDEVGITYLSHFPQNGAHQWSTTYFKTALWRDVPYTAQTSAQKPETFSRGVPY
jgi:hypothetical protein